MSRNGSLVLTNLIAVKRWFLIGVKYETKEVTQGRF